MKLVEVEYYCKECDEMFAVYHDNDERNEECGWCSGKIAETGVTKQLKGEYIVTDYGGIEVARRLAIVDWL